MKKSDPKGTSNQKAVAGFSDGEKAAMKERLRELKAEAEKADGESALLAKISEMPEPDRTFGERLHALVKANAPKLKAKTWYGMPAYADEDGKVVCFFQSAQKFNSRYSTVGFTDRAKLDEDAFWPTTYALTKWTPEVETRITALVRKAVH